MTTKQRSRLIGGLLLILLGGFFFALQIYPQLGKWMTDFMEWPLYVVGAGVLLLILGLLAGAPGMAVPACIVAGIGGLLYYQNVSGDWASWRYAWTLIIGFVGVGVILEGILHRRAGMGLRDGAWLLLISGILFLIFSSVTGGPLSLGVYWPVLVILVGLWLLIGAVVGRHKRRDNFFWGLMLVLLGVLFQADYLGYFPNIDVWAVFLALFLIGLGFWFMLKGLWKRQATVEHVQVLLEGAQRGALVLRHAAGRLELSGADLGDKLVEGDCGGGAGVRKLRVGDLLEAELGARGEVLAADEQRLDWRLKASRAVGYERVEVHSGASEGDLDFSEMRIDNIIIKTGASATRVVTPREGVTRFSGDVGAASLRVVVPEGVAASIRGRGGLFTLTVDEKRFPRQGDAYVSPDFDTAVNRLEMEVTAGLGSVQVE